MSMARRVSLQTSNFVLTLQIGLLLDLLVMIRSSGIIHHRVI